MKKKRRSNDVRVQSPCSQDWNEMIGNDQVRFCTHCAKDVNNLSTMTHKEAMRLVRKSNGNLCVRYMTHPATKAPVFANQLTQISRRVPRVAAGVMGASLSLSTFAYAQGRAVPVTAKPSPAPTVEKLADEERTKTVESSEEVEVRGSISGKIFDANNDILPGAAVGLVDAEGKEVQSTSSDYEGGYRFEGITPGKYQIVVVASGYFKHRSAIQIRDAGERVADITLAVLRYTTGLMISNTSRRHNSPLMDAVEDDEIDKVRDLISAGADVNKPEDDDSTPLFAAVENGNVEMVQLLLNFGAKVNVRNDEKETPLMMLDDETPLEIVELLIRKGANVNAVADDGETALIRAADEASAAIVKALIDADAEVNVQNKEGVSALMNAADSDDLEKVRLLVFAGADVNLRDEEGDNAWDYTTEEEIENFLVTHGVVVDPEDLEDASSEEEPESDEETDTEEEPET